MKFQVIVGIIPEGANGGATLEIELGEREAAEVLGWLLARAGLCHAGIPAPRPSGPQPKIAARIQRALSEAGGGPLTTRDIMERLQADGWKTKSGDPINVAGALLRQMAKAGEVQRISAIGSIPALWAREEGAEEP